MATIEVSEEQLKKLVKVSPIQWKTTDKIRIVILQRGWVFVGKYIAGAVECRLENASTIRTWGTTKGLGEIAENGPTSTTKLDPCPTVRFHPLTVIATIDTNESKWKQHLS